MSTFIIIVMYILIGLLLSVLWALNERYRTWLYVIVNTDEYGCYYAEETPAGLFVCYIVFWPVAVFCVSIVVGYHTIGKMLIRVGDILVRITTSKKEE